jgi:two-component sensor histidine kinase
MIGTVQDITERKLAERRILSSLAEKDTVLRELHHRVKNNMQVISSLLSLQARYADIKNPQQALLETRERIRAMALIHERLYGSLDLAAVDMLDYLRYLADRLARLYHEVGLTLNIQVSGEPLKLAVDYALPSALIVNELITNAIRHAYSTAQRERLIEVRVADATSDRPKLMIRDYGRGIDTERLNDKPTSLGLVIVQALTRQLHGEIHFEVSNGTVVTLSFPVNIK